MDTYSVEIYIFELSPESRSWCRDQFMHILSKDEVVIHTSVVVHGVEYCYGEKGVEEREPKLRPQYDDDHFEEAVSRITTVGRTKLTKSEVEAEIEILRKDSTWFSYKFDPIEHNCHHFSDMLVKILCGEKSALPSEVYTFNKKLLSCWRSWVDEYYVQQNLEPVRYHLECINSC